MDKVKSLMKKTNARRATVKKYAKKRKLLKLLLMQEPQIIISTHSMEKQMNILVWNLVTLLLSVKSNHTSASSAKVQTF